MLTFNVGRRNGSDTVNTLINKLPFELHIPTGVTQKYTVDLVLGL